MPAINAAANPVSTVTSPSTAGGGNSAAGTSSEERPFAAVLAEQTGKAPGPRDKVRAPHTSDKAAPSDDSDAEAAVLATTLTITSDGQGLIPPFVVTDTLPSGDGAIAQDATDTQVQAAADLIQAVLTIAGTVPAPVQPDSADSRQAIAPDALATAKVATTTAVAAPAIAAESGIAAGSRGESIADMRLAVARSAHGEIPADDGNVPAKLAAASNGMASPTEVRTAQPKEVFALPVETRAGQPADALAAKPDSGLAQAAASMAAAVPMQAAPAAAQTSHAGEYRIVTPVGSQHWEAAVGNSLVIMSGSRQDRAELVLTPPQLGRIEVSISMKGDEATAMFISANPAVRDALESALPRLREILADAGITLGQTQVGAESQGQAASERQNGDNASRREIAAVTDAGESPAGSGSRNAAAHRVISRSLVDTYA